MENKRHEMHKFLIMSEIVVIEAEMRSGTCMKSSGGWKCSAYDRIRVVDGENSIEGSIQEISLFQIELIDNANNTVLYPNNLLLQKPVIKLSDSNELVRGELLAATAKREGVR
jgi:small-conductance mechanosensitive channel